MAPRTTAKAAKRTTANATKTPPAQNVGALFGQVWTLTLASVSNPDFMGYGRADQDADQTAKGSLPSQTVPVTCLHEASARFRAWITSEDLGGGNLARDAGDVRDAQGRFIAHISYNGRVWPRRDWQSGDVEILPVDPGVTP